jgi:hypothetical protein
VRRLRPELDYYLGASMSPIHQAVALMSDLSLLFNHFKKNLFHPPPGLLTSGLKNNLRLVATAQHQCYKLLPTGDDQVFILICFIFPSFLKFRRYFAATKNGDPVDPVRPSISVG